MFITVFVTVPDVKVARKITQNLLHQKLCACVNVINKVESFYWWQGKIDSSQECLLVIKTRKTLFSQLEKAVLSLHPYQVPEIVALPLVKLSSKYAAWIKAETKSR